MLDNNTNGTPEPNGYELQRAVERVEKNVHDGVAEIKVLIGTLVSRELFDFESRVQNERISKLEKVVEVNEMAAITSKQRFWLQTVIPLLTIVTAISITIINLHH